MSRATINCVSELRHFKNMAVKNFLTISNKTIFSTFLGPTTLFHFNCMLLSNSFTFETDNFLSKIIIVTIRDNDNNEEPGVARGKNFEKEKC